MIRKLLLPVAILFTSLISYGQSKYNYNFNDKVKLTGKISSLSEKSDDGGTTTFTGLKTRSSYNVKCLTNDCEDFNNQTTFITYFKSKTETKKYLNKNVVIYGTFYFALSHGGVSPEHPYIKIEKITVVK